ncbi:hypothetical protein [Empedobacter sp.]|uniref:hypothetical protein n=1 Tax=Empedobacter sp. TaxID=1927715 RepID=UPI0028A184B7|nr:hypothetical protein [Empedobacter sp.]
MIRIAVENDIPELKRMMIKLLQHHQEFNALYQIDLTYKHDIDDFFKGILQTEYKNICSRNRKSVDGIYYLFETSSSEIFCD